jgi:GT2 family glycosyltransferase
VSEPGEERVDVVIPVYNAPELTRKCIDSLYRHVEHRIGSVLVHDNASDEPTARMLDALSHPRLDVYHAPANTGFGSGVNQGIARASSDLVLVLNSDVEAQDDFVTPLIEALHSEPHMIAVTPSGSELSGYDLGRYVQRSGCVVSYSLLGYAFLMRRSLFREIGGFDEQFGLGYFEDVDLARRLVGEDNWFGIHTGSALLHADHGSFSEFSARKSLLESNRHLYHARYPEARRNVIVASRTPHLAELPSDLRRELEQILRAGGEVHWLARSQPDTLIALQMKGERLGAATLYLLSRKARRRDYMQLELWLCRDLPRFRRAFLERYARSTGMKLRVFGNESAGCSGQISGRPQPL